MGGVTTGPAAVDSRSIQAAYDVIRSHLRVTPVLELDRTDLGLAAGRLVLKLEQLQHAGSFKTRGAFANLLLRRLPPAGVVAASGGNHGVAVAYPATLLVSVGGGGLIGGLAAWYAGAVRVVGVEPEAAPTLFRALEAGRPVDAEAGGIAADSLAPRRVGTLMFPIARAHVERVALVSDAAIRRAQQVLWDRARLVAEPGAVATVAALLEGAYVPAPDERVGLVISGGNTTAVEFR